MPRLIRPMMASLRRELPRDDDRYGWEFKWDGVRAVSYLGGGKSRANAPSAPLKTAPHAMTGPAADVPSTMTVAASCVREVTPSFR